MVGLGAAAGTIVCAGAGFGFEGAGGSWKNGRAYDPEGGTSYKSYLELQPDGSLKVSGCVLFICESRRWTRPR